MPNDAESLQISAENKNFDIDRALDNGPFSIFTALIIFAIAFAVILEAVNNNLLGLALPKMMDDWKKPHEFFKYAVIVSMVGMASGAFISGVIADKIGRRDVILLSLPICGIATWFIGACSSMGELVILRFLVGFGYGGLLPIASSLSAEFSSKRWRTMAVTIPIVCVPVGTVLAGFLFNFALPIGGWRYAFYIGGVLPLILCGILYFFLPESPRFMAQNRKKWAKLCRLLRRLGYQVDDKTIFIDDFGHIAEKSRKGGIKALFQNDLAGDTIAIWVAAFFGIAGLYAVYMWLPTMLSIEGVSEADSLTATAYWFSIGGFIGAFLCAWGVSRFGSRATMIIFAVGSTVTIFALLTFEVKEHLLLMFVFLGLHGLFNNGIQVPLYAIFANLYPTHIRATGSSMASSVGKVGTIFAGFLGGVLSVRGYFFFLTIFAVFVLLALIVFKRHIKRHIIATNKNA